jgi:hypothetical protein
VVSGREAKALVDQLGASNHAEEVARQLLRPRNTHGAAGMVQIHHTHSYSARRRGPSTCRESIIPARAGAQTRRFVKLGVSDLIDGAAGTSRGVAKTPLGGRRQRWPGKTSLWRASLTSRLRPPSSRSGGASGGQGRCPRRWGGGRTPFLAALAPRSHRSQAQEGTAQSGTHLSTASVAGAGPSRPRPVHSVRATGASTSPLRRGPRSEPPPTGWWPSPGRWQVAGTSPSITQTASGPNA